MKDYYPFGMMMPGRTINSSSYRYSINGQEKENELNENITSAEFWMYDSRIARRWNMDPKPNPSISVYNAFAGNPIWFGDPKGDTVILSKSFQENDVWMKRYRTFSQTKEGKQFLKDYGIGGKYEKVAVTLDVKELYWYRGTTEAYSVNQKNISDKRPILAPEDQGGHKEPVASLRRGDVLKATLTFNWDRIDEEEAAKDPLYKKISLPRISGGQTILHETQHLRIITSQVLDKKQQTLSANQQHILMKDEKKEYYKARLNYLYQYRQYYQRQYGKDWNKQIKTEVNEFDN